MKHLLTILSGLLVALLFARCADDDNLSGGIDGLPERGIVIRLSTGELDTRTQLTSTGDYHHVEEVWAVLYKLEGTDANDLNNYKLKGNPTKLGSMEDGQFVAWNPYKAPDAPKFNPADPDNPTDAEREKYEQELAEYNNKWGGEYGNGKVQGREFVLPESGAMTAGTYRVLCIGFDEASKTCYGLQNGSSLTLSGTLAEAYAKLSNKEFGGELFAGWTEFEFEPDNINIAEVELKRRVAGVLCYVNDIPTTITEAGETYNINTIRLCLNTKANDAIHLCRLDDRTKDFGTSNGIFTEEKTILAEYKIPEEIIKKHQGEVQGQGKEIFEGNLGQFEDTNVRIKEGSVLLGAYLIPIKHVEGKATLSVELLGKDENGNEKLAKTFNAVRSDDPDGQLTDESGATIDSQNTTSYDILPNYIYHIGNKDDDIDEPMSLLGQKITVVPKEWTGETIPVEFPSVPIKPKMDIPYGASYVFDCIPQTITIEVTNSILNSPWTLQAGNGIYFKTDEGYSYQYEAKSEDYQKDGPVEVEMLIADFAELDAPEMREIEIKLLGEDKTTVVATHTVKQYSAIVVETEENVYRGFSRFDLGTDRNSVDGSVISNEGTRPWNYYYSRYGTISNWSADDIYGTGASESLGETNLINAKSKAEQEGEFTLFNFVGPQNYEDDYDSKWADIVTEESAIYAAGLSSYTGGATSASLNGHYWYLPAHNEMEAFIKKAVKDKKIEEWNLVRQRSSDSKDDLEHHKYWTSTAYGTLTAHTHYINTKGEGAHDIPTGNDYRTYWRHVRRACDITSINN